MAYEIPDNISEGLHGPLEAVSSQVDVFPIGILLLIFLAIFGSGSGASVGRNGKAQTKMWLAISSFITTTLGFILFLYDQIISLEVMILLVTATIGFAVLYIVTED